MTGMAGRVYMIGVDHGVDDLQCGIWPLAQGAAQPSLQMIVKNLRGKGHVVNIDDAEVGAASQHLLKVARRYGLPVGEPAEYDDTHYDHQIPGGMLSNLRSQLEHAKLLDHFAQLIEEVQVVRRDLGWPTMVTPFAQIVANQALINIVTGKRYATVPDEVVHYVLGHYGKLLTPVEPGVLDKILARASKDAKKSPEEMEPALPALRKRHPNASDEERFLRYMIPESAVEDTVKEQQARAERAAARQAEHGPISSMLVNLLAKAASLKDVAEVSIRSGDISVRVMR